AQGYDYGTRYSGNNELTMNVQDGRSYLERYANVTKRMKAFVDDGGFCVVFGRRLPVLRLAFAEGGREFHDMTSALPYYGAECIAGEGHNIEWTADDTFKALGLATEGSWEYRVYFSGGQLKPIAHVKGHPEQYVAGYYVTPSGGHLLVVPTPIEDDPNTALIVIEAIRETYLRSKGTGSVLSSPDWTNGFLLPTEADLMTAIDKTAADLKTLYKRQKIEQKNLADLQRLKMLMSGRDSALEKVVGDVLTELGMKVEPGKKKRADWTAVWNGRPLAIEVQGVKRGAAEDHARSLVIWVQEVAMEKGGAEPKGLLIVNTFRDEVPSARTGNSWPGQTIDICKRNGLCAITGLQLLGLLFDARKNPSKKAALVQQMLDTAGVFEGYDDWTAVLTQRRPAVSR
ncbi:MAG: hypothetical protein ACREI2_15240, partial [Nitrospiraceae bacterium]